MGLHCFKKHVLSTNFHGNRKRRVKKFFYYKRTCKTQWKVKFRFIQEPWIHLLVKSQNPQSQFSVELPWRKNNEKLHFRIWLFLFAIVLRCWNPVEYIQILSHCSDWWNELWSETFKTVKNLEPAICSCSAR